MPGVSRRRFLQFTGLGAAAAAIGASGCTAAAGAGGSSPAAKTLPNGWTGTVADVRHVVILMQENRSFDHYFGTLRGVRGFGDKQALRYQNGTGILPATMRPVGLTVTDAGIVIGTYEPAGPVRLGQM